MLADDRIELLEFQFFRRRAFVFGRRVEMPRTGGGNQFDLVAHGGTPLELFTAGAQFGENGIDTFFIDDTHTVRGYPQTYETPLALDPEPVYVKIGQEPTAGFVIGVGYIISGGGTLARHLADSGHRTYLQSITGAAKSAGLSQAV
jgi:hypothetical protein